jgi:hypothetical protein
MKKVNVDCRHSYIVGAHDVDSANVDDITVSGDDVIVVRGGKAQTFHGYPYAYAEDLAVQDRIAQYVKKNCHYLFEDMCRSDLWTGLANARPSFKAFIEHMLREIGYVHLCNDSDVIAYVAALCLTEWYRTDSYWAMRAELGK